MKNCIKLYKIALENLGEMAPRYSVRLQYEYEDTLLLTRPNSQTYAALVAAGSPTVLGCSNDCDIGCT